MSVAWDSAFVTRTRESRPLDVLPLTAVVAVLTVLRWRQMGPLPTGLDGGEWLALGRGLSGGVGRSSDGAYAPLVPLIAHLLAQVQPPPAAIQTIALGTFALLLMAVGLVAVRETGPWIAAGIVLAAGSAGTVTEPLAFGGYPQHLAFAALMVALSGLATFQLRGGWGWWTVAATGFSAASLAHHIYFPLGVGTAMVMVSVHAATGWPKRGPRMTLVGLASLIPGIALALPTMLAFRNAGYAPPLDAASFTLPAAWHYATREAVLPWTMLVALAPVALWAVRQRPSALWLLSSGLLLTSGAGFVLSAEPRLVPAILIAALLAIGLWLASSPSDVTDRLPGRAATVAAIIAVALIAWRGNGEATAYFRFYRVLDKSTLAAAGEIQASAADGIVAVRADRRGWPVGWWYEGLTTRPIMVGSDAKWLGFPGEQIAAETVAGIFDGALTAAELRARAEQAGISLLVCRKWDWIGWERWLAGPAPAVRVVFDDDVTLVLEVVEPEPPENAGV